MTHTFAWLHGQYFLWLHGSYDLYMVDFYFLATCSKFLSIFNFMIFTDFNFNFILSLFYFYFYFYIYFISCIRKWLPVIWKENHHLREKGSLKACFGKIHRLFLERKGSTGYIYIFIWENTRSIDSFGTKWIWDHIEEPFESPPRRQSCHEKRRPSLCHNRYQHKGFIKENERMDMGGH